MRVTVIIVTLDRPECLHRCLDCLHAQSSAASQIIVVDASAADDTRNVVRRFPSVLYLRNENGFGRMTESRNMGLLNATGDVIAFVDDDAFARPEWLAAIIQPYADDSVGAVGGRALNHQSDEGRTGLDEIGRLKANGSLTGYFAADPGRLLDVDHVIGCNMSFRREVLCELGGFRTDYPGVSALREDTDICLRVKRLGHRIVFNPAAVVEHIGAPQPRGRRFDTRYAHYLSRNHAILLIRNFGLRPIVWRSACEELIGSLIETITRFAAAALRFISRVLGLAVGTVGGIRRLIWERQEPRRKDATGRAISLALQNASHRAATSDEVKT